MTETAMAIMIIALMFGTCLILYITWTYVENYTLVKEALKKKEEQKISLKDRG